MVFGKTFEENIDDIEQDITELRGLLREGKEPEGEV
jgi:hypothetical protein